LQIESRNGIPAPSDYWAAIAGENGPSLFR